VPCSAQMRPRALLVLLLVFSLVWSQLELLRSEWMYVGLGGAGFLAIAAVALRLPGPLAVRDLAVVLLVACLLHQFEAHGLDLSGRRYAFLASANALLGPALGCPLDAACPLTPDAVFWASTTLGWWPLTLAVVAGPARPFLTVAGAGLLATDALAHLAAAAVEADYHPGLLTAVVLLMPLSFFASRALVRDLGASRFQLGLGLAWGALGLALVGLGAYATYAAHALPTFAYPLLLLGWGTLPMAVAPAPVSG